MTTARQELLDILMIFGDYYSSGTLERAAEKILVWHSRHQPSVSRESVEAVLEQHLSLFHLSLFHPAKEHHRAIVTDLLALLNVPEEPKVWCDHAFLQGSEWFFKSSHDSPFIGCVPDRWTVCPICAAPRPIREAR